MFNVELIVAEIMSCHSLALLRTAFGTASMLAPQATADAAFRLFCTPPKPRNLSARQRMLIAGAEQRLAESELVQVSHADGHVAAYVFNRAGESRGTVLLMHGWTGKSLFMMAFVEPLVHAGFRVIAVDLPAHGASSGRKLHLPLAVQAFSAVHDHFGPWHSVIAHSFGGAVATTLLAGAVPAFPAIAVQKLVLISAPNAMSDIFNGFGSMVGLGERAQRALNRKVLSLSGRPIEAFVGGDMLRELQLPTLVLHAPDDKEVSFDNAHGFLAAGDFVKLEAVAGLGHRRILYDQRVIDKAAAFISA